MMTNPLYLDYCATTPCDPLVVETMLPFFTSHFGNAASKDHVYGWQAKNAVEEAREEIAQAIGAISHQIIFTSGATESINLALKGIAEASKEKGRHLITSKTEHKAVLDCCAYLERKGFSISYLEVDADGRISLTALEDAICEETICIAIMYANNETGVIHPVKKIGELAKRYGICFLCDATQAIGKIPVNVQDDGIDLMAFSSHKLYGPKGIGALFIRDNDREIAMLPQQHGGGHERGKRSGTLNTPGIVGFSTALTIALKHLKEECARLQDLRDEMEGRLLQQIPGSSINGGGSRLPHVSNITLPDIDGEQLLLSVSKYMALGRGSACSGLVQQPSHVLLAMGLSEERAFQSIRISIGKFTEKAELHRAVTTLSETIQKLRLKQSAFGVYK